MRRNFLSGGVKQIEEPGVTCALDKFTLLKDSSCTLRLQIKGNAVKDYVLSPQVCNTTQQSCSIPDAIYQLLVSVQSAKTALTLETDAAKLNLEAGNSLRFRYLRPHNEIFGLKSS